MSEQIGLIFFFSATVLSVCIVLICSFRQYINNLNNSSGSLCEKIFCRRRRGREEVEYSEQYYTDRVLAEALQRRLNEEERERERAVKRKERRMWYEYYMRPCTMVVTNSDLFHAKGKDSLADNEPVDEATIEVENGNHQTLKDEDDEFMDSDAEEIGENSRKRKDCNCISCDEEDENAALYLKLPTKGRLVDGTCALCIEEYDVGDDVVWSDLQCSHAFHKECLMQWLSKGKKRCPVCRHWFVPGTKIDDQKIAHGEAWKRALAEMERRENGEKEGEELQAKQERQGQATDKLEQDIAERTSANNLSMGQNFDSETSDTRSREIELGSNIPRNSTKDSDHSRGSYNSGIETSEFLDIENQQTSPNQKETTVEFRARNVNDDGFGSSREVHEHKNESSDKSEYRIADEYTQA
eukprot:CAMPEP_0172362200 /NCGR_PEP_ID=MMETSP1060-20121228/5863_1 /TAXON_ID=37318 /ORGANISM="Pseudo-nitzschia pungens, Strain cf. cingulata" /LENGTH=411 /DNA_ID=CAMNT_0013084649 /DNA_START=70 /DNA_END=1305 /DNA_ORIENTATION=-